jgi:PEP-CTERM motif
MHFLSRSIAVFAVSLALPASWALADSITTETISISGTMPVLGTVATSQFAAFNPAMGTMVSMSVTLAGTLDYTGGGIPADEGASLELEDQSFPSYYANLANVFIPALGNGLPFSFTPSGISDPVVLSDYTGTGPRDLIVYDAGGNFTDHITMKGTGTVTFDFIPAQVPEPGTLGLMVFGLFGIISARRRPIH